MNLYYITVCIGVNNKLIVLVLLVLVLVQQVEEVKPNKVLLVADDTDICVLLLHFCCQGDIPASTSVLMVSPPIRGRVVIDINATVDLPRDIIPDLLAAHGLTECDTVATYFGIGKVAALRSLTAVGDNTVGQSEAGAPKLDSLPPTNEAFDENVSRAQTGSKQPVWKLFNMVTMTTINLKLIHYCC